MTVAEKPYQRWTFCQGGTGRGVPPLPGEILGRIQLFDIDLGDFRPSSRLVTWQDVKLIGRTFLIRRIAELTTPPTSALPDAVLERLRRPAGRRAGWPRVTEDDLQFARTLLDATRAALASRWVPPAIASTSSGGIAIEWIGPKRRLVLEIEGGLAEYLLADANQANAEFQEDVLADGAGELANLIGRALAE